MKKLLALFLALALMASFATVFSASEDSAASNPEDATLPSSPAVEAEPPEMPDLKKQIVPESEVPDLIDYSVAVAEQYVCRAYWEESDLNEVVFLKSDGTLARYYFAIPVKYEENGEVFDKKPALVERETLLADLYRYELTAQNDTAFYCPDNLTHGFLYQGGDMEVALRPITQSEYDFLRGHINAGDLVLPENPGFDSQAVTGVAKSALSVTDEETTAPHYVLSTEGEQVNSVASGQDILSAVPSYNGFQLQLNLAEGALTQTVYFELDSELLPIPTEGGLLLCDQKGNPVGILGDLLSESGVQNDIPWTVTESLSGTYLLSATLPRNGQTYTLSTTNLFDYLLDASIYDSDQTNYGQSANLWIGYHSTVQQERVLIRPNNWYFTEDEISNQVVQSATVTLRDITATEHEAGIEVRPFFGNVWEENTVTWASASGNSYGAILDTKAVSAAIGSSEGYYYSFNVTPLVQNWYKGVSNWQKGMIFRWNVDTMCYPMEKCFASSQYSNENYRPRLEITTAALSTIESGVYELESYAAGTGYYLSAEPVAVDNYATTATAETQPLSLKPKQTDSLHQKWRITHIQNNYYTIRPYHYTPAGLYTSGSAAVTAALGTSDLWEEVASGFLWYIEATPLPGGGYGNCFSLYPYGSGFSLGVYNSSSSWGVYAGDGYGGTDHKWSFTEVLNPTVEARLYRLGGDKPENIGAPVDGVQTVHAYDDEVATLFSMGYLLSFCVPIGESLSPASYRWESSGENTSVIYSSNEVSFRLNGFGHTDIKLYMDSTSAEELHLKVFFYNSGNYYIRNNQTKLSLQLVDGVGDSGPSVKTSILQGDSSQNWELEKHERMNSQQQKEIYYTISCTVNNEKYYLSLSQASVSDGDPVILRSSTTITEEILWKVYHYQMSSTPEYILLRIAPKIDIGYSLACSVQDNAFESSLIVQEFNGFQEKQNWEMNPVASYDKLIRVKLFADESYQETTNYVQNIVNLVERAKLFYMANFGVFFDYSCVENKRSLADQCSTAGGSASKHCLCLGEGVPHHTNMQANLIDISEGSAFDEIYIMFTDNSFCEVPSCADVSALGTALYGYRSIIMRSASSNDNYFEVLVHEIGHLFSASDHYDKVPDDGDRVYTLEEIIQEKGEGYNNTCIYGTEKDEEHVRKNMILCPGCRRDIQVALDLHFQIEGGTE